MKATSSTPSTGLYRLTTDIPILTACVMIAFVLQRWYTHHGEDIPRSVLVPAVNLALIGVLNRRMPRTRRGQIRNTAIWAAVGLLSLCWLFLPEVL